LYKKNVKLDHGAKASFELQPLADVHFNTKYEDMYLRKAHLPTLYGLMGIAIFILIIAAINFINLSTALSVKRTKEIGVRKVLGSSKSKLVFQFLSETFLLTLIAVILAVLLVPPILSSMSTFIPEGVALELSKPSTIIFLALVCIITSLLAGFYPAKILSSFLPAVSLKGQGSEKTNRRSYFRKGLIVFQFTVSLVFIIGTLVVGNQMHYLLNKDMGFNKDAVINFSPEWRQGGDKAKLFAEKVRNISGVQLASADMGTPAEKGHWGTIIECKETSAENVESQMIGGDENYLPLYQLKLIAGRNLQRSDTIKEFLINETCARTLGFKKPEDALGKMLTTGMSDGDGRKNCPIVGVISDFHSQSLHEPIKAAFMIESKLFCRSISIKLNTKGKKTSDFSGIIDNVEKAWKEVYPDEKFEYTFFDQTIANFYQKEKKTAGIMNLAMIVAIFISCMGLFGLAAFTSQQRTKEIGIRKVLGASVPGIITLLSKDFLKPVFISIVIASPIAWYFMHKWLQDFAYRVSISWWIFIIGGLAAIIIAVLTVGLQTIKTAVSNPVKSLRSE
jgi:ABC-type lipoprotein release transport system permease subunit